MLQQKLLLQLYLDNFHSDQRWLVKVYNHTYRKYPSTKPINAAFFTDNIKGKSILIYTAPATEFFYGKFTNDEYRDFDHVKNWKTLGILKKMRNMPTFFEYVPPLDDHGGVVKGDL